MNDITYNDHTMEAHTWIKEAHQLMFERSFKRAFEILEKLLQESNHRINDSTLLNKINELKNESPMTDQAAILYYMATCLREENKHKLSASYYEKAMEAFENQNKISDVKEEDLLTDFALCLVRDGSTHRSKQLYERALNLNSRNVTAISGLSACYLILGDILMAKKLIENAKSIDPSYYHIYHVSGMLLDEEKDYEGAIEMYTKASILNPMYARSHYNKALTFEKKFRFSEAIQEYEECLRIDPNHSHSIQNLSYLYYQDSGQRDKSKKLLDEFMKNNDDADTLSSISDSFRDLGEDTKACEVITRAIILQPQNALLYVKRAHLLKYLERIDEAISDYEKACELDPTNEDHKIMLRNFKFGPSRHTLVVTGDDTACQLGNISLEDQSHCLWKPISYSVLNDRINQIVAGSQFSVFWGDNVGNIPKIYECGLLNQQTFSIFEEVPLPDDASSIQQISCGLNHYMVLLSDGRLFGKGLNSEHCLSLPIPDHIYHDLTLIDTSQCVTESIQSIICGYASSAVITTNNTFYITGIAPSFKLDSCISCKTLSFLSERKMIIWGKNRKLLLKSIRGDDEKFVDLDLQLHEDVVKITSGYLFSFILTNLGNLFLYGSLFDNNYEDEHSWLNKPITKINTFSFSPVTYSPIKDVACGLYSAFVITRDHSFYAIGDGRNGELGLGESLPSIAQFTKIPGLENPLLNAVAAGSHSTFFYRSLILEQQTIERSFNFKRKFKTDIVIECLR
nr:unnamed protein product [Naegleria fowleri]